MKNILILHTGGTIGMVSSKGKMENLRPSSVGRHFLDWVPELKKLARITVKVLDNIDSSDVTPEYWTRWITILKKNYKSYDGFVITHGTDTMVYTASAVSFALGRCDRPIVFTGSQRPLSLVRTDARENLINSVELAVLGPSEVMLCFGNRLLRATRSTKFSATDFVAFESFNFPHLARAGVKIEMNWKSLNSKQKAPSGKPKWFMNFEKDVFSFKLFPGISAQILRGIVNNSVCRGIVLEAFGSGTVPSLDESILNIISHSTKIGKPVVIVSQCPHGRVDLHLYPGGIEAEKRGALSAGDMTAEAATVKLMHGLGQNLGTEQLKKYFLKNICGERSI